MVKPLNKFLSLCIYPVSLENPKHKDFLIAIYEPKGSLDIRLKNHAIDVFSAQD